MREITVPSGAADLAVTIAGDGAPALVFLHAGVCDRRMWEAQLAAFAGRHRVVAYDRRGFGATKYRPESYRFIDDLDAVLKASVDGAAVLVGCSQGGRIAVDFAFTYPARVAGLVLVAPAISGAPEPETYPPVIQALIEAGEAAERDEDTDRLNAIEAHAWLDGPAEREGRVRGGLRELFLDMNGRALRAPSPGEETGAVAAFERFGALKMPVAFVLGGLDFPYINARSRLLRDMVAAELIEIADAAHVPSFERPDAFNDFVRAWLARHAADHVLRADG